MSHIASLHERYETYRAAFRAVAFVHPTSKAPLSFKAWRDATKNEIRCARCGISETDSETIGGVVVEMTYAPPFAEGLSMTRGVPPKLLCAPCYEAIVTGMMACWNEVV